jgi:type I restriction enzyme S subunit
MPTKKAKQGDVLMSVRAPVGDLNISTVDCCIGRGLAALRGKGCSNSFLFYLMKILKKVVTLSNNEGTVFGSISKDELSELQIIIPDKMRIHDFDNYVLKLDYMVKLYSNENKLLKEISKLLLIKMVKK